MSLKKIFCALLGGVSLLAAAFVLAAEPKDITYKSKGSKVMGGTYFEYSVHCSDGKSRTITAWDDRKKWCVGDSSECTNDQLKAAKLACK